MFYFNTNIPNLFFLWQNIGDIKKLKVLSEGVGDVHPQIPPLHPSLKVVLFPVSSQLTQQPKTSLNHQNHHWQTEIHEQDASWLLQKMRLSCYWESKTCDTALIHLGIYIKWRNTRNRRVKTWNLTIATSRFNSVNPLKYQACIFKLFQSTH